MNQSSSYSDSEEQNSPIEDRTFNHAVRKMKTKVYPQVMPKHVSEMRGYTIYDQDKLGVNTPAEYNQA